MYQSEFPTEVYGFQPTPVFELFLLIAVIVLPILAYLLGRAAGRKDAERVQVDAAETIYKAIRAKAVAAASATRHDVSARADALAGEIRSRLEEVAAFGGPLGRHLDAIEQALGRGGHEAPGEDHAHAESRDQAHASQAQVTVNTNVTVGGGHGAGGGRASPEDPVARLRAAVAGFNDWWLKGELQKERVREMEAARKRLSSTPPLPPAAAKK